MALNSDSSLEHDALMNIWWFVFWRTLKQHKRSSAEFANVHAFEFSLSFFWLYVHAFDDSKSMRLATIYVCSERHLHCRSSTRRRSWWTRTSIGQQKFRWPAKSWLLQWLLLEWSVEGAFASDVVWLLSEETKDTTRGSVCESHIVRGTRLRLSSRWSCRSSWLWSASHGVCPKVPKL